MPERLETLRRWAVAHWPGGEPGRLAAEPVEPDGSGRFFARLDDGSMSLIGMYCPENIPEARAWAHLAGLLGAIGVPVPRVLAAEPERGLFLCADLGRSSLHALALEAAADAAALEALYEPVLEALARLQALGAKGLDTAVCFDGARLDAAFLLRREAGYFVDKFAVAACGLVPGPAVLAELARHAELAAGAGPWGLVHRDFQSRNVIFGPNGPGIVDFQGARLGPAQYDLASLLHDPYVDLPWAVREALLARYIEIRRGLGPLDEAEFRRGWPHVSLSRVFQALGAYGFLCLERGKPFFAAHARPALATARRLLADPALADFTALRRFLAQLPDDPGPLLAARAGEEKSR